MCQSIAATTSCMIPDCQSVIQPRRSNDRTLVEHTRLLSNIKYVRLSESRGFVVPSCRRPSTATNSDNHDRVKLDQNALPLSSANQVFQVGFCRIL